MVRTTSLVVISALALVMAGCSKPGVTVSDKDGNSVNVSTDGHTFSAQGKDGSNAQMTTDSNNTHIEGTDKDGTHVTENIDKNGISMTNSKGESVHEGAGAVSEDDLGVPFYPGSQESKAGLSVVSTDKNGKAAISFRTTTDDPQKVIDFYKDKITAPKNTTSNTDGNIMDMVSGTLSNDREIAVIVQKSGTQDATIEVTVNDKKKS